MVWVTPAIFVSWCSSETQSSFFPLNHLIFFCLLRDLALSIISPYCIFISQWNLVYHSPEWNLLSANNTVIRPCYLFKGDYKLHEVRGCVEYVMTWAWFLDQYMSSVYFANEQIHVIPPPPRLCNPVSIKTWLSSQPQRQCNFSEFYFLYKKQRK